MKITWADIKKNLRIVSGENLEAYESKRELTSDYEFEFNFVPDAKYIDYYILSENIIKAVGHSLNSKEMLDIGISSNWDGEKITEIDWTDKVNNNMQLITMKEYATLCEDDYENNG
jgi:hypothetical protein